MDNIGRLNEAMARVERAGALGMADAVRDLAQVVAAILRDQENRLASLERGALEGEGIIM